jgi:hypothetical protein
MPTEIRRPSAPIIRQAGAPDASPLGLIPLGIIATLAIVLHFAAYAVLDRSHAGQITPTIVGAAGDQATCTPETTQPELSLPYD